MLSLGTQAVVAHAFNRFGLGGRPDDVAPVNPRAWLLAQLKGADTAPVGGMPTVADGLSLVSTIYTATPGGTAWTGAVSAVEDLLLAELQDLYTIAVTTRAPFRERLVHFWTNHFAIMADRAEVMATAGAYVRDAIRPHVTGKFSDMLLAVMQHPAMLYSLDNDQSAGPHSPLAAAFAKQGVVISNNENLARETLELFTLGATGPYTQSDVDALAMLLTGYKVAIVTTPRGFGFDPSQAEPGAQTLLGVSHPGTASGAASALRALGTHSATATHLATKLVTHFVSDTPTAADIARVASVFAATGGDLAATAGALVSLPSAWTTQTKLRSPSDLAIAAMRATGTSAAAVPNMFGWLTPLGSLPFRSDFPNGWSDLAADWLGPEQISLRVDWMRWFATLVAMRGSEAPTVGATEASSVAPFLSKATKGAIAGMSAPQDQLTVLFTSPEFQRR